MFHPAEFGDYRNILHVQSYSSCLFSAETNPCVRNPRKYFCAEGKLDSQTCQDGNLTFCLTMNPQSANIFIPTYPANERSRDCHIEYLRLKRN